MVIYDSQHNRVKDSNEICSIVCKLSELALNLIFRNDFFINVLFRQ